jgi:aldose 1-epimerase
MPGLTPLTIGSDALRIRVLPLGAALVGAYLTGQDRNLVLGFADPHDHARLPGFAGSIVGPVANRIRGGVLTIDGDVYQMPQNEAGQTTLHSGPDGLHTRIWQVQAHSPDRLILGITLPEGACGLPGTRVITADYHITERSLTLTLSAVTDRPTAINLAPHAYWNLDGHADISGHTLQINADRIVPTDAQNLPTGAVIPVADTAFDFTTARRVPLTPALDVNYCLSDAPLTTPRPAATLIGADGTQLSIATTAPGLQVYNGAFLPDIPGVLPGMKPLRPYHGIALEPQFWPDAPHHPHFPQITLYPNQTFRQITQYRITPAK